MTDDGTEIFHHDPDVKSLLDVEIIKVLSFKGNGRMDRLLQDLCIYLARSCCDKLWHTSSVLDLLRVAREGDLALFKVPVQMLGPWSKVFNHITKRPRRHSPMIL